MIDLLSISILNLVIMCLSNKRYKLIIFQLISIIIGTIFGKGINDLWERTHGG